MRRRDHQSGFGTTVVLLAVLVVAVLAVTGLVVYQHHKSNTKSAAATSSPTTTTQPKSTTTTQPAQATTQYLTIKEWGVKLPLSDSIKDAYYVVPAGISPNGDGKPSSIDFGLTSQNSSCGIVTSDSSSFSHTLGSIVRALPTETDPVSGKPYTQLDPNGTTIGSYYYGYANAELKNKTCTSATTIQSIDSAFAAAVKGAVSATSTTN